MAIVSPAADAFVAVAGFSIAAWLLRGRSGYVATTEQAIYRAMFDRPPSRQSLHFWASVVFWYVFLFFVAVGSAGVVSTAITLVS